MIFFIKPKKTIKNTNSNWLISPCKYNHVVLWLYKRFSSHLCHVFNILHPLQYLFALKKYTQFKYYE